MGEKKKNNINNIFYAVIGVATLMVAVIGATFAYFTATASNNVITGNMATIDFDITVAKVSTSDDDKGGIIPMSNNMMEQALKSAKGICVDDNGNAVCQVYKITVYNESSASMFVDGYVTLTGGSGDPADYEYTAGEGTTMRWAQAFCSTENAQGKVTSCTTAGNSTTRTSSTVALAALGGSGVASSGLNTGEIISTFTNATGTYNINGANSYRVIKNNYIRVSDHSSSDTTYTRTEDVTSALVYNQFLEADDKNAGNNTGTSSTTFKDAQVYYIVIWLSENGHNQTAGANGTGVSATGFYQGKVTFITAQGSEVTATFADHIRVTPNTNTNSGN